MNLLLDATKPFVDQRARELRLLAHMFDVVHRNSVVVTIHPSAYCSRLLADLDTESPTP